ncbi:MAG: nucleotidyltransferase family protein [Promethearchaeota archaeon]
MITLEEVKKQLVPILVQHQIQKASIFGSLARGETTESSDVDILIELAEDASLLDFIGIKFDIEEKLGLCIDLVEYSALKPALKNQILKEQVAIL